MSRRVLKDAGTFLSATWAGQVLGMVRALAVARILAPERYGLLQLAFLVFEYARSSHGGLLFGMTKETSRAVGAGDAEGLQRSKDVAFTGALILGGAALLLVPLFAHFHPDASPEIGLAIMAGMVIALCASFHVFHVALLRAQGLIVKASATIFIFHFLYATSAIFAAWFWGVRGIYCGLALSYLIVAYLARRASVWRFSLALDFAELRKLFRRGFPVLVVSFLFRLISSVDKILVTSFFGISGLGIYGLAQRAGGLAASTAESLRWVTLPGFLENAGRSPDPKPQRERLLALVGGMSFLLPPALASAALFCHLPLRWFLPDYLAAADPARVLLLGAGFLTLAGVPRALLVALDLEARLVAAQFLTILLLVAGGFAVHASGGGLVGMAQTTILARAAYAVTVLTLALHATRMPLGPALRSTALLVTPQCVVVLSVILVGAWQSPGQLLLPWSWGWPQGFAGVGLALALVWMGSLGAGAWLGTARAFLRALPRSFRRQAGQSVEHPATPTDVVAHPVGSEN